jgi:hypothetical protein
LPHLGLQSLSVVAFAPAGQQPSPSACEVIVTGMQTALHCAADPTSICRMQPLPPPQLAGQSPSHFSLPSRTPLPHLGLQSLSVVEYAPSGQHPSPSTGEVIMMGMQTALHCAADPTSICRMQPLPPPQLAGQSPSHFSALSRTPFPHFGSQSLSVVESAPAGQHWSPLMAAMTAECAH